MKFSIVLTTYNHCDDLLKPCIESVLNYTDMQDVELIISANGCTDHTAYYLADLQDQFVAQGKANHIKIVWSPEPLGYAGAVNAGVKAASTDYIILLSNDVILLAQEKHTWIKLFYHEFESNPKCGISTVVKMYSPEIASDFAWFFCVMIHRKVFDAIGLVSEDYGVGSFEDVDFSIKTTRAGFDIMQALPMSAIRAGLFSGDFPIYHIGQVTMKDTDLFTDYNKVIHFNSLKSARTYNPHYYKEKLRTFKSDYGCILFKGEPIPVLEYAMYHWAKQNTLGNSVLEVGCSNGFGSILFPDSVQYTGIDADETIAYCATLENWGKNKVFLHADVTEFPMTHYDTIIALNVLDQIPNSPDVIEKLKTHCKRLIITTSNFNMLRHLSGFDISYIDHQGTISTQYVDMCVSIAGIYNNNSTT